MSNLLKFLTKQITYIIVRQGIKITSSYPRPFKSYTNGTIKMYDFYFVIFIRE